jgi:hypothetical protein
MVFLSGNVNDISSCSPAGSVANNFGDVGSFGNAALSNREGRGGTITIFSEGKSQGRDFSQKRVEEDHKTCGRGRVEY